MYCPRCGRPPVSDELRFCSYCGFKLGVVKASLSDSEDVQGSNLADARTLFHEPRHRDINIGVILMFFLCLLASVVARWLGTGGREVGAVILAISYLPLLFLSRPITKAIHKLLSWDESADANLSVSSRGMAFGATLMFVLEIELAISSLLLFGRMRTTPFYIGLLAEFAFLLAASPFILRALRYLLVPESSIALSQLPETADRNAVPLVFTSPALETGQEVPISILGSNRVNTSEIISPPSITEHTTNLLENK